VPPNQGQWTIFLHFYCTLLCKKGVTPHKQILDEGTDPPDQGRKLHPKEARWLSTNKPILSWGALLLYEICCLQVDSDRKIFGEEGSGSGLDFGGWKGGGFFFGNKSEDLNERGVLELSKIYLLLLFQKQLRDRLQNRGILMGIDIDIYDIGAIDEGDFYTIFKTTWASAYDNAGGSEEQDGLSILQYADDTLNNSDWKIWMEREAYLSYRGSRENRLLSLINEDGITNKVLAGHLDGYSILYDFATVATVLATVPLNWQVYYIL
ncbi:hypothetical protein ACJX0J_040068, partial [Zea mays]